MSRTKKDSKPNLESYHRKEDELYDTLTVIKRINVVN